VLCFRVSLGIPSEQNHKLLTLKMKTLRSRGNQNNLTKDMVQPPAIQIQNQNNLTKDMAQPPAIQIQNQNNLTKDMAQPPAIQIQNPAIFFSGTHILYSLLNYASESYTNTKSDRIIVLYLQHLERHRTLSYIRTTREFARIFSSSSSSSSPLCF